MRPSCSKSSMRSRNPPSMRLRASRSSELMREKTSGMSSEMSCATWTLGPM